MAHFAENKKFFEHGLHGLTRMFYFILMRVRWTSLLL